VIATTGILMRRALNEVVRVPGAAMPGIIAPTLFMLGLTAVFGNLTSLHGFGTSHYLSFLAPVSLMQCAAFTGAATGVNLARDIEQGWFDRLLVAPVARPALLGAVVLSAGLRVLMPVACLLAVGFALGLDWPGFDGMLIVLVFVPAFAVVAALWGSSLALRFRTQAAGPLIQSGMFMLILFTSSYAPLSLLQGWLRQVATYNPATQIIEALRAGFVGGASWHETWQGGLSLLGLGALFGAFALRNMASIGR
jgi:ABC-2 type transport system permease protein